MSGFNRKMSNDWYAFYTQYEGDGYLLWHLSDSRSIFRPSSLARDLRFERRSGAFYYPNLEGEHLFKVFSATFYDCSNERLVIVKEDIFNDRNWPRIELTFGTAFNFRSSADVSSKWGSDSRDLLIGKLFGDYFGGKSGAKCVECGVFNEYVPSGSGYVCGSCRSYRRMWG